MIRVRGRSERPPVPLLAPRTIDRTEERAAAAGGVHPVGRDVLQGALARPAHRPGQPAVRQFRFAAGAAIGEAAVKGRSQRWSRHRLFGA
jgi:hypothetical protein